ncbi:tetratricopeptide repeat protein [Chloroflexota bacterium]
MSPYAKITSFLSYCILVLLATTNLGCDFKDNFIGDIHFGRGRCLADEGHYSEAIIEFSEAIKYRDFFPRAYWVRAIAYNKIGSHELAIADSTQAIEMSPTLTEAYNERGVAYGCLDQHTEAIANFDIAIMLDPELAQSYYNRGLSYKQQGNYEKATADFIKFAQLAGTLANNSQWVLLAEQQLEEIENIRKE